VRPVVPELQKRGLYRTRYEGATLRENLGLARPPAGAWQARVARRELKVPACTFLTDLTEEISPMPSGDVTSVRAETTSTHGRFIVSANAKHFHESLASKIVLSLTPAGNGT